MTLESLLKDYTAYNLWANEKMIYWLKATPLEYMEREVLSSFPSLRSTLMHIWAAEDVWLQRLQNLSLSSFIAETFQGTNLELFEQLLQNSDSFKNFVHRQSTDFFDNTTQYKHTNGIVYEQCNAEIIQHCIQHSTYHRGQVVTIGRQLGLANPPKTDFIEYIRQRPSVPE